MLYQKILIYHRNIERPHHTIVKEDVIEEISKISAISPIFLKKKKVMRHRVGPYLGLNEIGSPSPMMNFITISYLFNCIFEFIH